MKLTFEQKEKIVNDIKTVYNEMVNVEMQVQKLENKLKNLETLLLITETDNS